MAEGVAIERLEQDLSEKLNLTPSNVNLPADTSKPDTAPKRQRQRKKKNKATENQVAVTDVNHESKAASDAGKPETKRPQRKDFGKKHSKLQAKQSSDSSGQSAAEPLNKPVAILTNPNKVVEPQQDAQNVPPQRNEPARKSEGCDETDRVTGADAKVVRRVIVGIRKREDEEIEDLAIPEGHVLIEVRSTPPPKPKMKRATSAKTVEKKDGEEPSGDGNNKPLQTSSEEEERRDSQPERILRVIMPQNDLDRYRRSGVLPLKRINEKFPRAFFHCRLCSFHVSSIGDTERHLKDARHLRLQEAERKKQTATLMPVPTEDIKESIGELVQSLYDCSCIDDEQMEIRHAALSTLQKMVEETFPDFTTRLYGSTFTGLGCNYSDVNVGLIWHEPKDEPVPGLMIINIFNWLRMAPVWTNVTEDFNCRVPVIRFKHQQLGVSFAMVIDGTSAYKTSLLLKEYQLLDPRFAVLTVAFRTFARICRLDQPDYGTLPTHAFTLMVLHYMQQARVLPVLHPKMDEDTFLSARDYEDKKNAGTWRPSKKSLGNLWLGLLKFYAYKFSYQDHAVCVRSLEPVTRSSKNWGNRRMAMEDPFHTNVNLASPLGTALSFEFFLECMSNLYLYFWVPQTANGPLFTQLVLPGEGADCAALVLTPAEAKEKMSQLKKDDLKWNFKTDNILRSKQLPLACTVCTNSGHSKLNCPELEVPPVGFLPPPDVRYMTLLDQVCFNIFRNFTQHEKDIAIRENIRRDLEQYVQSEYEDAMLTLFGSSCNGFGFVDSDMDVCMTFQSNADGKGLDFGAIVKKLGKMLRRNRMFTDVVPISSAKVPIVKIRHRPTRLEADISLYNQLGRRNSHLLSTYAAIDPRVRILGYMAKLMAKQCDIGDASRGTLSSYAYTLMVLFYLQQTSPPVIPVLQEITVDGIDRNKYLVEGRDTWFFDDLPNLGRVWPHLGANRESPSSLWLGFLRYYADVFNFRQQVVCIRQLKPLFRLEKMWTERTMAIEDPFDLSHNLGSGLSLRMGVYIRKVFGHAWRVFQTPLSVLPRGFTCLEEYLFNPRVLAPSAPPPNDRGCNICDKIGHRARDCDMNRANRNKRHESDDSDDSQPSKGPERPAQQEPNQNGRKPFVAPPRNHQAAQQQARRFYQGPPVRHNSRPAGHHVNRQRAPPHNWRPRPPAPVPPPQLAP